MTDKYFTGIGPIGFEGPDTKNPLAYRYYDKDRVIRGKRMEEHLRIAVAYWHTFCGDGSDVFGDGTFDRAWNRGGSPIERAQMKLEAAFEFFEKLGTPYFCFHDRDISPEGASLAESNDILDKIADQAAAQMERTGVKLLWGTANLFGHPRFMSGAATNPNPEVFAYAAAQVKKCLEVTHRLGGENYILWGGREGYETLLNTDLKQEGEQLGRFLTLVAEHKHKIGFKGPLCIEPKPKEPTKHQYDFDTATVYAFLQKYDLLADYKVNIEVNHAQLAGHTFEHEIAVAMANGIFGSVDINRGDTLLGWDTDQFPNAVSEVVLGMLYILKAGGFETGGFNFDAHVRRQSIDPEDLFYAHVGGIDTLARALVVADAILQDGQLEKLITERYAGWKQEPYAKMLAGKMSLEEISAFALEKKLDPKPRSGRQEMLENLVARFAP